MAKVLVNVLIWVDEDLTDDLDIPGILDYLHDSVKYGEFGRDDIEDVWVETDETVNKDVLV